MEDEFHYLWVRKADSKVANSDSAVLWSPNNCLVRYPNKTPKPAEVTDPFLILFLLVNTGSNE